MEKIGHPVRLVECGAQNIKVTTFDDLYTAEGILRSRLDDPDLYSRIENLSKEYAALIDEDDD